MGKLVVSRVEDGFGILRQMKILVDGQQLAKLGSGERVSLEVGTGRHQVEGRMDWARSAAHQIEVSDGSSSGVEFEFPFVKGLINTFVHPGRAIRVRTIAVGDTAEDTP